MSWNPGYQYKDVSVVKTISSLSHHSLHPLLIPTLWLQVRWGNAVRDLWDLTAHSALPVTVKILRNKRVFSSGGFTFTSRRQVTLNVSIILICKVGYFQKHQGDDDHFGHWNSSSQWNLYLNQCLVKTIWQASKGESYTQSWQCPEHPQFPQILLHRQLEILF